MQSELEALSNNQENRDAANKARAAANTIKGQQIQDRIQQGKALLDNGTPQNGYYGYAAQQERAIEQALDNVQKQIGQAAAAANNSEEKKLQTALNQAGDTSQRLQSLQRRLQELQQQGQQGQQGQRGQQGQEPAEPA